MALTSSTCKLPSREATTTWLLSSVSFKPATGPPPVLCCHMDVVGARRSQAKTVPVHSIRISEKTSKTMQNKTRKCFVPHWNLIMPSNSSMECFESLLVLILRKNINHRSEGGKPQTVMEFHAVTANKFSAFKNKRTYHLQHPRPQGFQPQLRLETTRLPHAQRIQPPEHILCTQTDPNHLTKQNGSSRRKHITFPFFSFI